MNIHLKSVPGAVVIMAAAPHCVKTANVDAQNERVMNFIFENGAVGCNETTMVRADVSFIEQYLMFGISFGFGVLRLKNRMIH